MKKSEFTKLDDDKNETKSNGVARKSWSCTKPGDFLSPPGSTRYLLREKVVSDQFQDVKTEDLSSSESLVHQV